MIDLNFFTQKVKVSDNETKFIIEPLPMSFGNSLGNALRRTLLSSIKGAAVTQVKIDDCPHLFTTIKGVKESALEITMNLKQLHFKFEGKGPFKIKLQAKKKGKIYAKDIEGEVEVINKDLYLAEITDAKGKLDLEAVVEVGVGYLQAKEQTKKEFGYVPLDAFFSPVKKVNFKVEETRVGGKTNFDRLILEVATDDSVLPEQALREGTEILAGLFGRLLSGEDKPQLKGEKSIEQKQQEALDTKYSEIIIDELNLPSRIINALLREKIETVADLIRAGREKLSVMKGVGKKSIELIDEELKKMNIQL